MNASPDIVQYELIKRVAFSSRACMRYKYVRIREELAHVLLHLSLFLRSCSYYFLGQNTKRRCKAVENGSFFFVLILRALWLVTIKVTGSLFCFHSLYADGSILTVERGVFGGVVNVFSPPEIMI